MSTRADPTYIEAETVWIITGVLSSSILLLIILVLMLMWHVKKLNRRVTFMAPEDGEHAFRAPAILPGEELEKRGFSQYGGTGGNKDVSDTYSIGNRPLSIYSPPQTPRKF